VGIVANHDDVYAELARGELGLAQKDPPARTAQ
jgi:hypothetical protein